MQPLYFFRKNSIHLSREEIDVTGLLIFLAGIDQKGEKAMDEKKYTEIMFEGTNEKPLYLNDGNIILTGEGGNRHILISAGDG